MPPMAGAAAARSAAGKKRPSGQGATKEVKVIPQILPHQRLAKDYYDSFLVQISIAVLIAVNFVVSATEAQMLPQDKGDDAGVANFKGFEYFFAVAFSVELVWNMYGSFFKHFYTCDDRYWNYFDFLVVAVVDLELMGLLTGGIGVLRLLRAFRVFRLFKRVESLKLIIEGIVASLPGVLNAFVVLLVFMGIWSIMGTDFFGGYMPQHFGHFFKSMLTMFQILTLDGWCSTVTRPLVFANKEKDYPSEDYDIIEGGSAISSVFFVSYVFIASIVLNNVIVAILLERYLGKVRELQDRKREEKAAAGVEPPVKKELVFTDSLPNQARMRGMYRSNAVQIAVALLIFSNFVMSAVEAQVLPEEGWFDDPTPFFAVEAFYAAAFLVELIINIYAHGGHQCTGEFWRGADSAWNTFDFVIVMISLLSLVFTNLPGISVLRLFRAFRVFRLFKRVESLRLIIEAILKCLPSVGQAFCILAIIMGIWSIMAVEFFRDAMPFHFGNFFKAMFTMTQILTGDSWCSALTRTLVFTHGQPFAFVFFISYIFVAMIILSNVIIAILLEGYLKCSKDAENKRIQEEIDNDLRDELKDIASEATEKGLNKEECEQRVTQRKLLHEMGKVMDYYKNNLVDATDRFDTPLKNIIQLLNNYPDLSDELRAAAEDFKRSQNEYNGSVLLLVLGLAGGHTTRRASSRQS